MASISVPQNTCEIDQGWDVGWEERIYGESCAWARQRAEAYIEELDEALYEARAGDWRVLGFRRRMLVTRFGEVGVRRRLYQDDHGGGRFLVDEHLGLPERQLATSSVMKAVVELSGEIGFAKAGKQLAALTAGVLSTATVWRLKEKVSRAALTAAEAEGRAVYDEGQRPYEEGKREVEQLFVGADGVYVRLQGEPSRHMEIKCGIAYEGWERVGGVRERYRLQGKRVYVHGLDTLSFWEGASLAWSHHWDWQGVKQVVLGGDGASWIAAGTAWFDHSFWQLDGFHLARAAGRALGGPSGGELFQLMRSGDFVAANHLWDKTPKQKHKSAKPAIRWLGNLLADQQGQDWRQQCNCDDDTLRALGSMEGNITQLIAARMKGKGRSWSRQGAIHMAVLRQLIVNDELSKWCQRSPPASPIPADNQPSRRRKRDTSSWLQANVPAFYGPHSQRLWVQSLNHMVHPRLPN